MTRKWLSFLPLLLAFPGYAQSDPGSLRSFYNPYGRSGGKTISYKVKAGETLFDVAEKFLGDPYRAEELQHLNGIEDPLRVKPGTEVKVPAPNLQIEYSLERLLASGDVEETAGSKPLSPDDRFRLRISSNMPGYLYVFNRTASGDVRRVLPARGEKPKYIRQFGEYLTPQKHWFRLDRAKGDEDLLLLVSAEPLNSLDASLISQDSDLLDASLGKAVSGYFDDKLASKGVDVVEASGDESSTVVTSSNFGGGTVLAHVVKIRRR